MVPLNKRSPLNMVLLNQRSPLNMAPLNTGFDFRKVVL